MKERFISECIRPVEGTFMSADVPIGEPALPGKFLWRDTEYEVADVLEKWRETSPCKSGAKENYARKHWFRFTTKCGCEMKVYFERQPRSKSQAKSRWWLFTLLTEA